MPYTRVEQDHSKKILIQNPSSLLFGNNLALFASELCTTKYPECLKFSHCHGSCMVPGTITGLQTKLIELADICPPLECPEEPDLRVSGPCLICPKSISQRLLPVKEQEAAYLSEHIEIGKKKKNEHRRMNPEIETKSNYFCEVQIASSENEYVLKKKPAWAVIVLLPWKLRNKQFCIMSALGLCS